MMTVPAEWGSFCVTVGSASGALIGLQLATQEHPGGMTADWTERISEERFQAQSRAVNEPEGA